MSKKSARRARALRQLMNAPDDPIGTKIDEFENAYDDAAHAAIVLKALASAKASETTDGEENLLWLGLADLATRILAGADQMDACATVIANALPESDHVRVMRGTK